MNRILSLTFLSFIAFNTFAQERKTSLAINFGNAPHDFKIGWYEVDNESFDDFNVRKLNFSVGLKARYQLRNNVSFRLRTSFLNIDFYEYKDTELVYSAARSKQQKLQLAPGITFSMVQNQFSIYGGFEALAYFHGQVKTEYSFQDKYTKTVTEKSTSSIPGGFTFGLAPLVGFTYNLSSVFFLEAEGSMLFHYGSVGGRTVSSDENLRSTEDYLKGLFSEASVSFGCGIRL